MQWDDNIDGPHLEIASSKANRIGVLAGPGTGKTSFGLMRRVARLLSENVPGHRILLVSFTRVAARDLRDKVATMEVEGADSVKATTLHSYCLGLLTREAVLAITNRQPRILLSHERDLMLRDLTGDFGDIYERRARLKAFEAGWVRGTDEHPGDVPLPADKQFEASVLSWLREHRCMLIGEVVPIAHQYLTANPGAEELQAFDHLVIDEYQDLNRLEQSLLDTLATYAVSMCVAGDDDQSIYSMRYARPDGILEYCDREETHSIEIGVCGRCPQRVVSMANSLMAHAADREKPALGCNHADEGNVAIVQWAGLQEEIDGVVSAIAADLEQERREPGEILVLTGRRGIGERVRNQLRDLGVAAESFFTEEELDSEDSQRALALFRLALDAKDAPALRVIVGLGDASGRSAAYNKLRQAAAQEDCTVREILERVAKGEHLVNVPAIAKRFVEATETIASFNLDDLSALVDAIFPEDEAALSDLRRIALAALPLAPDAQALFDALIVAVTQEDVPSNPAYVRVMSLHKSKGLTSPAVFVVGAVEGILPMIDTKQNADAQQEDIDEQRRLLFVGLTRAANQLVISTSLKMKMGEAKSMGVTTGNVWNDGTGLVTTTIASRYLNELGPDAPQPVTGVKWIEGY